MMPIPWVFSVAPLLDCPPYIHNKTQVLLEKPSTKIKKSETNKSTKSSVTYPPLPPIPTGTELEETSIYPPKSWATFKTSCICSTNSTKKNSNLIQNSSEPSKFFSSFMPNTNLTAQLQPSGICLPQALMFTLALQVLQEPFMVQNMEVPMKQF